MPHPLFDAKAVLDRIARESVTVLPGPPTIYHSLLALSFSTKDVASLRLAITGAAKVPVTLIHEMRDTLGIDVVLTAYGLTENSGVVSMCRADDPIETISNTAGRPIDGVKVRIVDSEGEPVEIGQPGHLHVAGIGVMRGYVGDAVATAKALGADGWLRTGDVAVMDESGSIAITDRSDDMFTVGGFNAYPAEIEGLMSAHPASATYVFDAIRINEKANHYWTLTESRAIVYPTIFRAHSSKWRGSGQFDERGDVMAKSNIRIAKRA